MVYLVHYPIITFTVQAMAGDDPELLQWFKTDDCKENMAPPTITVAKQQGQSSVTHDEGSQDGMSETSYDGQ